MNHTHKTKWLRCGVPSPRKTKASPFGEAEATENPAAVVSPAAGEMHWGWVCMEVLVMMVCGQTLRVCSPKAAAFCGLVLAFGSKLVSCDAAGLPFGMVSEPRRRLEATPAGSLVEYLAVKMYFRVSAEFLELCQRASTCIGRRLKDVWASAVADSRRLGRLSMTEPESRPSGAFR